MTDKLQVLCFGAFLMAYYYFVLRKYNTLGFRMFSLFFFIGLSVSYWWYSSDQDLKNIQQNGVPTQALVLKKTANSLEVSFTNPSGKSLVRTQTGGISVDEFAAVTEGQTTPILYSPRSDTFYLTSSFQRQLNDTIYILGFAGVLFLIGTLCWIFLYKYRVHAYGDGSIFEYVTDESGKVVLDDAQNGLTKSLRTYSTMSKLFQLFSR
ncbi:hypothetical protein EXU85_30860 [Spirosoma sp. KCTC 42546]|uniref:hypothetical protein n=1 Tax=Spirosoma sp. KCTC 42546 TaxID=2520506 RepID=UPI001158C6E4|nr:hypothetical protein [Spirosoma sp. KCTC 42546]QDK82773.1 hypothetical protein EXU85_30860 [Spirosoma sp. KCTC 42546]